MTAAAKANAAGDGRPPGRPDCARDPRRWSYPGVPSGASPPDASARVSTGPPWDVAVPVASARDAEVPARMPPRHRFVGGVEGTHCSTNRASIGPPDHQGRERDEHPEDERRPRSASSSPMAVSGPGWGGTSPCRIDSPASAGMPTRIERDLRTARHQDDDRDEQHDADLEEQRQAEDGRDQRHRPRQPPGPTRPMIVSTMVGPAGVREQLADHRTERDQHAHSSTVAPNPVMKLVDDVDRRHPGDHTHHRRAQHQGEERVHLAPGDQHDHGGDAEHARPGSAARCRRRSGSGCLGERQQVREVRAVRAQACSFRWPSAASARSRTWAALPSLVTATPGSSGPSGSSVASWLGSNEAGM